MVSYCLWLPTARWDVKSGPRTPAPALTARCLSSYFSRESCCSATPGVSNHSYSSYRRSSCRIVTDRTWLRSVEPLAAHLAESIRIERDSVSTVLMLTGWGDITDRAPMRRPPRLPLAATAATFRAGVAVLPLLECRTTHCSSCSSRGCICSSCQTDRDGSSLLLVAPNRYG